MAFRVRTPDGELSFATLLDVETAFHQGLVDPDDEVVDEATGQVHRAREHPWFRPPPPRRFWQDAGAQSARIAVAVVFCVAALVAGAVQQWWLALPTLVVAFAMVLRIAITAQMRSKRR
jgi:hypothetical protein